MKTQPASQRPQHPRILATLLSLSVFSIALPGLAADAPIAGLAPWQRPAGAPVITAEPDARLAKIKQAGLRGVIEPYPASLKFLANQGGWYNPFLHSGMTAPYDLRGWHAAANPANPTNSSASH